MFSNITCLKPNGIKLHLSVSSSHDILGVSFYSVKVSLHSSFRDIILNKLVIKILTQTRFCCDVLPS